MGIPKFFRWLSERYPCISQVVTDDQIPQFDNLYLDMNGIVHNCSHGNSTDPNFKITEEQVFEDVFSYVDTLFHIIKPQKVFYLAIDGVAPRAKMNQQRARRFRSAQEAEELREAAKKKGTEITGDHFDSNCITPGTPFMERLSATLRYFIAQKVSTDRRWKNCKVIFSGPETPGEGEHKIMSFIRDAQSDPNWNPKTRHCLYGLDADLIMLGLVSHEPYFSLLREEVSFGRSNNKKANDAKATTFNLLHLSLVREYAKAEFSFGEIDFERVLDDWILICFLVGNDFIPHLPGLHINTNGLDHLFDCYSTLLKSQDGGYLNNAGILDLRTFQMYIKLVSVLDKDQFEADVAAMNWLGSKSSSHNEGGLLGTLDIEETLEGLVLDDDNEDAPVVDENGWKVVQPTTSKPKKAKVPTNADKDFEDWRMSYYNDKFASEMRENPMEHKKIANEYVRALQWILHYYYLGVQSWEWYFPYHYAPYASDIVDIEQTVDLHFDMGTPFTPLQQLMSVLPTRSKALVPECMHVLMTAKNSLIHDFYPMDFEMDLNGKKNDWEAVILLPFIDEKRLIKAIDTRKHLLSEVENSRNVPKLETSYRYCKGSKNTFKSPRIEKYPPLENLETIEEDYQPPSYEIKPFSTIVGKNIEIDPLLGFPTIMNLPVSFRKTSEYKVNIFGQEAKGASMIIDLDVAHIEKFESAKSASDIIGKIGYMSWPHLKECLICGVQDATESIRLEGDFNGAVSPDKIDQTAREIIPFTHKEDMASFKKEAKHATDSYELRKGARIGKTNVIVEVRKLSGFHTMLDTSSEKGGFKVVKTFAKLVERIPLQVLVQSDKPYEAITKSLDEQFPMDSFGFITSRNNHYGTMIQVKGVEKASLTVLAHSYPQILRVDQMLQKRHPPEKYFSLHYMSQRLKISTRTLSKITSSCQLQGPRRSHFEIGLCVKFQGKNLQRDGFCRKAGTYWEFSQRCFQVIADYVDAFPDVFAVLESQVGNNNRLGLSDVFQIAETAKEDAQKVITFLKSFIDLQNNALNPVDTVSCTKAAIADIEKERIAFAEKHKINLQTLKNIKPETIFQPSDSPIAADPDNDFMLGDRVVCVMNTGAVPCGFLGTVVTVYGGESQNVQVVFDEEFVGGNTLGGKCAHSRGITIRKPALMNLSFGNRFRAGYYTNQQQQRQQQQQHFQREGQQFQESKAIYQQQQQQYHYQQQQQQYQAQQYQQQQQQQHQNGGGRGGRRGRGRGRGNHQPQQQQQQLPQSQPPAHTQHNLAPVTVRSTKILKRPGTGKTTHSSNQTQDQQQQQQQQSHNGKANNPKRKQNNNSKGNGPPEKQNSKGGNSEDHLSQLWNQLEGSSNNNTNNATAAKNNPTGKQNSSNNNGNKGNNNKNNKKKSNNQPKKQQSAPAISQDSNSGPSVVDTPPSVSGNDDDSGIIDDFLATLKMKNEQQKQSIEIKKQKSNPNVQEGSSSGDLMDPAMFLKN